MDEDIKYGKIYNNNHIERIHIKGDRKKAINYLLS